MVSRGFLRKKDVFFSPTEKQKQNSTSTPNSLFSLPFPSPHAPPPPTKKTAIKQLNRVFCSDKKYGCCECFPQVSNFDAKQADKTAPASARFGKFGGCTLHYGSFPFRTCSLKRARDPRKPTPSSYDDFDSWISGAIGVAEEAKRRRRKRKREGGKRKEEVEEIYLSFFIFSAFRGNELVTLLSSLSSSLPKRCPRLRSRRGGSCWRHRSCLPVSLSVRPVETSLNIDERFVEINQDKLSRSTSEKKLYPSTSSSVPRPARAESRGVDISLAPSGFKKAMR